MRSPAPPTDVAVSMTTTGSPTGSDPRPVAHSAPGTTAVDVSPEAIAALVSQGATALHGLPDLPESARPDALPLLVGITHDLRSPLSSMLVLIESLRSGQAGPVTPVQAKQLGLLYSAAFGIATLTNDVLDVARGGGYDLGALRQEPFPLDALWHTVRALVQPIAEERGLQLHWRGPQNERRLGNVALLQRVLLNLVTNALKFTDRGSVTVSADPLDHERVRFVISDTGRGLSAAVQARLATPPCEDSVALAGSGGLGIVLCQQLLASVGSALEQFPALGNQGTALGFTVTLRRVA